MTGRRILVVVLLVAALLALMTLIAQDGVQAQDSGRKDAGRECYAVCFAYGCPPPPPCLSAEFTHGVYLPVVGRYGGLPMPEFASGEESFRSSNVDRIVNVRGAMDEPWAQFRATILVTVIDATQMPVRYWACWYGAWGDGTGAARCDSLETGE